MRRSRGGWLRDWHRDRHRDWHRDWRCDRHRDGEVWRTTPVGSDMPPRPAPFDDEDEDDPDAPPPLGDPPPPIPVPPAEPPPLHVRAPRASACPALWGARATASAIRRGCAANPETVIAPARPRPQKRRGDPAAGLPQRRARIDCEAS